MSTSARENKGGRAFNEPFLFRPSKTILQYTFDVDIITVIILFPSKATKLESTVFLVLLKTKRYKDVETNMDFIPVSGFLSTNSFREMVLNK